jgi:hypothetical protein
MLSTRIFGLACAVTVFVCLMAAPVSAQPLDKRTLFTFSGPVTLPGVTLSTWWALRHGVSSFTPRGSQTPAALRKRVPTGVVCNDLDPGSSGRTRSVWDAHQRSRSARHGSKNSHSSKAPSDLGNGHSRGGLWSNQNHTSTDRAKGAQGYRRNLCQHSGSRSQPSRRSS